MSYFYHLLRVIYSFIFPPQCVVPPWFFVLAFLYTQTNSKTPEGLNYTERDEDKRKYQRNRERKTKRRQSERGRKSCGYTFTFYRSWMGEIQPFKGSKSDHISYHTGSYFPLPPRRSPPSSVTSGRGEKPFPERNKARNGGITESLSEWLNRPKLLLSAVRV